MPKRFWAMPPNFPDTSSVICSNDEDLSNYVNEKRIELSSEAKELIKEFFPRKIKELDELLKTELFKAEFDASKKTIVSIPEPTSGDYFLKDESSCTTKVPILFPGGSIDYNVEWQDIFSALTPHYNEVLSAVKKIQLALILLIPKVEDGNNTGVEIQRAALVNITSINDHIALNRFGVYDTKFATRGTYVVVRALAIFKSLHVFK